MKKKQFLSIALGLVITSLIWIVLTPIFFTPAQAEGGLTAPHPGFLAPGFSLESPEGENHALEDYRGQPVLVFFWASWCSVCKAAMPGLQEVYTEYQPRGFQILAVNTTFQDTLTVALSYFQAQRFTYPFLLDRDGSVSNTFALRALPTAVLVGPDGIVVDVVIGSGLSAGYLRAQLDQILTNEQ